MAGLVQSFKAALTDVDTTAQVPLGTIRYDLNGIHKYVQFSGTTAIAAGDALCYVASSGASDLMQIVDGANTNMPAGVANAAVASGSVQYGFIRIKGLATMSTALAGTPAVGDLLTTEGQTAPAVGKKTTANASVFGTARDVTNLLVAVDCPF